MKERPIALLTLAVLTVAGVLSACRAVAVPLQSKAEKKEADEKPEAKTWAKPPMPVAKIGPVQAMMVAKTKLGGGTPFGANFEYDEGHWVYGVLVVKGHKLYEVEVDPRTGKAVDSEGVNPADEAKEMRSGLAKVAAAGG